VKTVSLPEPEAVREIHAVRRRIQRRAEKIGWARYLEEINSRPSLLTDPARLALRERPARDYHSRCPPSNKEQETAHRIGFRNAAARFETPSPLR
jgi:hypothetical protein